MLIDNNTDWYQEVYGPLTVPVFGRGVVYDVDNARFMDQKRVCVSRVEATQEEMLLT